MEQKVCQCCSMPMASDEVYGTNADGSKNSEYCMYCYQNGEMQFKGTMDEMIEDCVPHMVSADPTMTADAARAMLAEIFPTLRYWKEKAM